MARALHRLGMFAARRKWVVLGAWILLLAVTFVLPGVATFVLLRAVLGDQNPRRAINTEMVSA